MSIGKNPLQYRGVRALTPPNLTVHNHAPSQYDYDNFVVGDWWLVLNVSLWYLQSKSSGLSTWVEVSTGSGFANSFPTDLGTATPVAGVLNIIAERSARNCGSTVLFEGTGNSVILNVTDVNNNTIIGEGSGSLSASGIDNSIFGGDCGSPITGNFNTLIAALAGANYTSSESGNVILGSSKGTALENNVMRLGNDGTGSTLTPTAKSFISGVYGVTVSSPQVVTIDSSGQLGSTSSSGTVTTLHTDDGNNVTATAGVINVAGSHGINTTGTIGPNTATFAINNTITLGDLSVIGTGASSVTATTGDISSLIGNLNLGVSNNAGTRGYLTIETVGGGAQIPVFGFQGNNIMIGGNAFAPSLVNGAAVANILIGGGYTSITTGRDNTVCGAGIATALTTGGNNCILGGAHTAINLTTGNSNTIIGTNAGTSLAAGLTTGSENILIGQNAGSLFTGNETQNIIIANSGVAGDTQITRIGGFTNYTTLKTFMDGIRGVTTTNNNAIAVLIDSAGQLGTVSSSRTKKDNIVDMGSYSDVIRDLRPVVFNYKEHSPESKSVGLIAEEVEEIAPQLVAYNQDGHVESVKYHDLVPMLLNEFQNHCHLIGELQAVHCQLLDRIRMLEEKAMQL